MWAFEAMQAVATGMSQESRKLADLSTRFSLQRLNHYLCQYLFAQTDVEAAARLCVSPVGAVGMPCYRLKVAIARSF